MKKTTTSKSDLLTKTWTKEADLQAAVIKWLEPQRRDGIVVLRICDRYTKGYADLFICVHGVFVCAELKDDTGHASPQQIEFLDKMLGAGAVVGICRTVGDVAKLVDIAKEKAKGWG